MCIYTYTYVLYVCVCYWKNANQVLFNPPPKYKLKKNYASWLEILYTWLETLYIPNGSVVEHRCQSVSSRCLAKAGALGTACESFAR